MDAVFFERNTTTKDRVAGILPARAESILLSVRLWFRGQVEDLLGDDRVTRGPEARDTL